MLANLPAEEIHLELNDEERQCDHCHQEMKPMGKKVVREEVHYVPARLYKKVYISHSYECHCHDPFLEPKPIKSSPTPTPLIQKSFVGATLLAWLLYMKFVLALPLYRQETEWKRYGLDISRRTLANWVIIGAEDWLAPIYDLLRQELLTRDVLHADETPYQILRRSDGKDASSKAQMWNFRTTRDEFHPIIWYHADLTRKQDVVDGILDGYTGYLQSDGHVAYKGDHQMMSVGCWAHMRRKLFEVPGHGQAKVGLAFCDKMFTIERKLQDLTEQERYLKRLELLKPFMDDFYTWVDGLHAMKGKLRTAITYARNQKECLMRVLDNGRIQLSNNICEQKIKSIVIGRKNYLFSTSERGARANAIVYSITESAKENGLDPFKYLTYLFDNLPKLAFHRNPALLKDFLPWADQVKSQCFPDYSSTHKSHLVA